MCQISEFWSSWASFWVPTPPGLMALLSTSLTLYPQNTPYLIGQSFDMWSSYPHLQTPVHTFPGEWVKSVPHWSFHSPRVCFFFPFLSVPFIGLYSPPGPCYITLLLSSLWVLVPIHSHSFPDHLTLPGQGYSLLQPVGVPLSRLSSFLLPGEPQHKSQLIGLGWHLSLSHQGKPRPPAYSITLLIL